MMQLLVFLLIVHLFAIRQALGLRTKLIAREKYFADTGKGNALAYVRIFLKCAIVSFVLYLILYIPNLLSALSSAKPAETSAPTLSSAQLVWLYVSSWLYWPIVPACCGVMTAYTLDRPAKTFFERSISGMLQAAIMAAAAILAVEMTVQTATTEYRLFVIVLYGGLGLVLGLLLPAEIKRYWNARASRLPDKISVLRTAVLQYFYDIQQFSEWLNARNEQLEGKRPAEVLTEDSGLQRLTAFVAETRTKVSFAPSTP
jgi:hypothetical protein